MHDFYFHTIIPPISLALIYLGIRFYGALGCATPLEAWFIGLESIILFGYLLFAFRGNLWLRTRPFVLKSLFALLIVAIIWDIVGIFWLIKGLILKSACLGIFGSFLLGTFQFFCLGAFAIGISFFWVLITFRKRPDSSEILVRQQLLKYYANEIGFTAQEVAIYLEKHREILSSLKILDVEKKLIREYFTLESTENKNEQECAVCLGTIEAGELKSAIGCEHEFHYECLGDWFGVRPSCPLCQLAFRPHLMVKFLENSQRGKISIDE